MGDASVTLLQVPKKLMNTEVFVRHACPITEVTLFHSISHTGIEKSFFFSVGFFQKYYEVIL